MTAHTHPYPPSICKNSFWSWISEKCKLIKLAREPQWFCCLGLIVRKGGKQRVGMPGRCLKFNSRCYNDFPRWTTFEKDLTTKVKEIKTITGASKCAPDPLLQRIPGVQRLHSLLVFHSIIGSRNCVRCACVVIMSICVYVWASILCWTQSTLLYHTTHSNMTESHMQRLCTINNEHQSNGGIFVSKMGSEPCAKLNLNNSKLHWAPPVCTKHALFCLNCSRNSLSRKAWQFRSKQSQRLPEFQSMCLIHYCRVFRGHNDHFFQFSLLNFWHWAYVLLVFACRALRVSECFSLRWTTTRTIQAHERAAQRNF